MMSILALLFWLMVSTVEAACTGSSPTWSATNDQASVQSCVNSAVNGDTITIASTSANWGSSSVTINGKNITVAGGGIGNTVISGTWTSGSLTNGAPFLIALNGQSNTSRITGMTLNVNNTAAGVIVDGEGWRVDNLRIVSTPAGALCDGVFAYGGHVTGLSYGPTGLIDHLQLVDCRILVYGWPDLPQNSGQIWTTALGLGDIHAVYLEDSTVTFTAVFDDFQDCNYGGRIVYRHNTINGHAEVHAHSSQGWRGCRRWETYNNVVTTDFPNAAIWYRGGTGVIFGNQLTWTGGGSAAIIFDNVRSASDLMNRPPIGTCDGTSTADGNAGLVNAPGWPCRDQIGWNTDAFQWTVLATAPAQTHQPAYIFKNTNSGSTITISTTNGDVYNANGHNYIQPNRDYYESGSMTVQTSSTLPFNGTSGVGFGTLANRPTTCTTYGDGSGAGVGYWATDQGNWNLSTSNPQGVQQNGASGLLYRCVATNTWALYYTPYQYPHTLQGAIAGTGGGGSLDLGSATPTPSGTVEVAAPAHPRPAPEHLRLVGR